MTELEAARDLLRGRNCTCVVMKPDQTLTSRERGIRPVLEWLEGTGMLSAAAWSVTR